MTAEVMPAETHQPTHAPRQRDGITAVIAPSAARAPYLTPTSLARVIDDGSQPNSTDAARTAATTRVAPIWPTRNATTSRMVRKCSSASASRHVRKGNQK